MLVEFSNEVTENEMCGVVTSGEIAQGDPDGCRRNADIVDMFRCLVKNHQRLRDPPTRAVSHHTC